MKSLIFKIMNRAGSLLSHRQRRFLLDRLGLARLVDRLATDEFDEVTLPNGLAICINPLLHAHLAKDGVLLYEEHVLNAIRNGLKRGGAFYDIGANVGVFSFVAASQVGHDGAVHAFEPEENNLVCFRRSLKRSGVANVFLHECAVGPEDGSMTFDRRGGAFSGRLVESGSKVEGDTVTVEVRSVDSLVREGAAPPTLVKIDVEGGEGGVLEGMRTTLKTHGPVVLCELHPFNPSGVQRALDVLTEEGYAFSDLGGKPIPQDTAQTDMPGHILARPARRDS